MSFVLSEIPRFQDINFLQWPSNNNNNNQWINNNNNEILIRYPYEFMIYFTHPNYFYDQR